MLREAERGVREFVLRAAERVPDDFGRRQGLLPVGRAAVRQWRVLFVSESLHQRQVLRIRLRVR
jgi:hypothetical protein